MRARDGSAPVCAPRNAPAATISTAAASTVATSSSFRMTGSRERVQRAGREVFAMRVTRMARVRAGERGNSQGEQRDEGGFLVHAERLAHRRGRHSSSA